MKREKLKIVQFMASEKFGGAEKVCIDLSNEFSKTHIVTVFVLRETEYLQRFSKNIAIVELTSHPTRHNPFLLYEIYRNIRKIRPDIIHTHGGKAAVLMRRLAHFTRINHLATKHNARKGRVFNTLPYVSVVSEEAKNSIKSECAQQIRCIHNGITPHPVQQKPEKSVFTIVAIGRLDKIKGFDVLIDQVASVHFPFKLLIAGEGDERIKLEQKINRLQLQDRVTLVGFCNDIPNLMASSHLIVMSSHSEGFPQVLVEALFYGNVLISTRVGGAVEVLPSVFLTGQNEMGGKITDIYDNYRYYFDRFESLKKEKAQRFLLSKITAEYEQFYQEILT